MTQKLFYFQNPEEFEECRKKAVKMLKQVGFNEEVLKDEIEDSKRDWGDEFFWTVAVSRDGKKLLEEWKETKDLSNKSVARDFVMRLTYDGD